jgi:hypothetical protein
LELVGDWLISRLRKHVPVPFSWLKDVVMKASCTITQKPDRTWLARHNSASLGTVEISAVSREQALSKLRDELQYRSEYCPCSGATVDTVELEVSEEPPQADR